MHKFIIAPPGAGKTLYARRLAETPPFPLHTSDGDRSYIYRVAGLDCPHMTSPFRAPHHTVSLAGLGGIIRHGYRWHPGEVSLAHGGTLFLDEVSEFSRATLEVLREPLKRGTMTLIDRVGFTVPARFRLVCTMNPCPCGYAGSERRECRCSPKTIESYLARVPQWLRDACETVSADELIKNVGEIV